MQLAKSTDIRRHLGHYLDLIAQGETVVLLRRGEPVAKLVPYEEPRRVRPSWKRAIEPRRLKGALIGETLRAEREAS